MKNENVINSFVNGEKVAKTGHLFIEENVLYSYGHHYPLSIRLNGAFLVNKDDYSKTTARHAGYLIRNISPASCLSDLKKRLQKGESFSNILLLNTQDMNRVIAMEPNTLEEVNKNLVLQAI